ncbi:MAG: glutamate--cysteine ligase [Phycisphaerales bacterium]|nr:MAG: glutamate--cysteine ligase [Phycisphaerales bacterium]
MTLRLHGRALRLNPEPEPAGGPPQGPPQAQGPGRALGLFEGFGIELEYMIVDAQTLDVRPVADALFEAIDPAGVRAGEACPDGPDGLVCWSNELAMHVLEMKTARPAGTLDGLAEAFQRHVRIANDALGSLGCCLLPGGAHPWMDPMSETVLWPHEYTEVYRTYDAIFGCQGHGWSNLQSTHVNLPFADDEQFGRLHAAIRLVLPLLPGLAASSPYVDGRAAACADQRLEFYRTNALRVPMMTALVVPEAVFTIEGYRRQILGALYEQLAPLDPAGVLRHEFANARGAIARFDRGAIEIRLLDIQECPAADLAIVRLIVEAVRAHVQERWIDSSAQRAVGVEPLHAQLLACIRDAEAATIDQGAILEAFGVTDGPLPCGALWRRLAEQLLPADHPDRAVLDRILSAGTLATRLRRAAGPSPSRQRLASVYAELARCLAQGCLFHA